MAISIDQLKRVLLQNDRVSGVSFESIDSESDTVNAFADTLVSRGVLTKFQASEVIKGDVGSLTLDRYILLDRIGAGGMGQFFWRGTGRCSVRWRSKYCRPS